MRYVIIGAGGIGGTLAARLAQHSLEHPPLLIARGDHALAIAANGLRLTTPEEDVRVPVVTASAAVEVELHPDDVLVVATKTHQAEAALLEWVDRPIVDSTGATIGTAGDLLPVVMVLNGVASERMALRLFSRVFGATVWMPGLHLVPGEVSVSTFPITGVFIVGRYAAPMDAADRELLATLESDWSAATFDVHVVDDVMGWKYRKLLSNLGNALEVLLGPGAESDSFVKRLREEAREIYTAAGIRIPTAEEEAVWRKDIFGGSRKVPGAPDEVGNSSWQSVARGSGSIETDYLNGEIAYLARSIGRDAPINAVVQRLARQVAVSRGRAGLMTAEQLESLLPRA